MEKIKHGSFSKIANSLTSSPKIHASRSSEGWDQHSRENSSENIENDALNVNQNLDQFSEEIDQFIDVLSTTTDNSNPIEVPESIESFCKIIESKIKRYKFGKITEEDVKFLQGVKRLSKLTSVINNYPSSAFTSPLLNRTSVILQEAMTFLEEEFQNLLDDSRKNPPSKKSFKNSSFNSKHGDQDRCSWKENESEKEIDFPGYSPEVVMKMNRIANTMVSSGYEKECSQVYSLLRRNAFGDHMKKLDFEKINMEDVHKMQWEPLEHEISKWINLVKACSNDLFPKEQQLCEIVFSEHLSISRTVFSSFARAVVIQLLDFAEAVSMTKRSAEKLFKFLDIYETLRELVPKISESCSGECEHELQSEIHNVAQRVGEAAVNIFTDLENSIKTDASRTPVPGGAVHPLTRYVLNYLKYACEYKETLEIIFQVHENFNNKSSDEPKETSKVDSGNESPSDHHGMVATTTPFSMQLVRIMDLLDTNLEGKSMLYKDVALPYVFLMNNGRYILQKVKGSDEIHQVMGDIWCRRRSGIVRQFHKNYQRETWAKVLHILNHEGLLVNGKLSKQLLKERFKAFSTMFDDIHRVQSTWVVSDEQLQSELRVSISSILIPAYRSFVGRFRHYLDSTKQAEKYIKYTPEDLEMLIEGFFEGNSTSMARRR